MGKNKIPATGEGYFGEIMVHRLIRASGVVEGVLEGKGRLAITTHVAASEWQWFGHAA